MRKSYFFIIFFIIVTQLVAQNITLKQPNLRKSIVGWSQSAPTIYWDKIDAAVSYEYALNQKDKFENIGNVLEFTPPISTTGIHTFYLRAVDKNNNKSKIAQIKFGLDTTPPLRPTITKILPSGWTNQKKVKIYWRGSLEDIGSGKDYYLGMIEGYAPTRDIPKDIWEVEFPTEGKHKIKICSVDKVGNISADEVIAYIDFTPPTLSTQIEILPSNITNTSQITISFKEGEDKLSGIGYYEYSLDKENWYKIDVTQFQLKEELKTGSYEIYIRAVDKANNKSEIISASFTVDSIPPEKITSLKVEENEKGEVIVTWDDKQVIDKETGISYFEGSYMEDKIEKVTSPWKLEGLKRGEKYIIKVYAVDNAGNRSESTEVEYKVPIIKKEKRKEILPQIDFAGSRITRIYRSVSISGVGKEGRAVGGYTAGSKWEQNMIIQAQGKVENTTVGVQIQDFQFQDRITLIELKGKRASAKLGNFSTGIRGGEFLSYTKQIEGVEVETKHKPFDLKLIYSQGTSFTKEEIIEVTEAKKGPFKLQAMMIIEGSETVWIDEKKGAGWELQQREKDYIIDYFTAELTFKKILSKGWQIKVAYEYSFWDILFRSGDVIGAESVIRLPNNNNLYLGYLHETSPAGGTGMISYYTTDKEIQPYTSPEKDMLILTREYPLLNWPVVERTETIEVRPDGSKILAVRKEEFDSNRTGYAENYVYQIDYNRGVISFVEPKGVTHEYPPGYKNEKGITASYSYTTAFVHAGEVNIDSTNCRMTTDTNEFKCKLPNTEDLNITSYNEIREDMTRVWIIKDNEEILLSLGNITEAIRQEYKLQPATGEIKILNQDRMKDLYNLCNIGGVGKVAETYKKIRIEYREVPTTMESPDKLTKDTIGATVNLKLANIPFTINAGYSICDALERFGRGISLNEKGEIADVREDVEGIDSTTVKPSTEDTTPIYYYLPIKNEELNTNTITLAHTTIKPNSEKVQFKGKEDTTWKTLNRGATGEYIIDYNFGKIIIIKDDYVPQEGDKIKITYEYFKDIKDITGFELKKIKGNALSLVTSFNLFKKIGLNFAYRRVEPKYLPVGTARPQPETQNINAGISYPITPYLKLDSNFSKSKRPEIVETYKKGKRETISETLSGSLAFSKEGLPTLNYNYSHQSNKDNLNTFDTKNISQSVKANYRYGEITSSVALTGTNTEDLIKKSEIKDKFYHFTFAYSPLSRKFDLKSDYQERKTETIPKEGLPTTRTTKANVVDFTFLPIDIIRLTGRYDVQNIYDEKHPKGYKIYKRDAGLNISPINIYPFTSFNATISHEKNPAEIPVRTTHTFNLSLPLSITKIFSLTPNYYYSKSRTTSTTTTKNYSIRGDYSPNWGVNFRLSSDYNYQESETEQVAQPTTFRESENYGVDLSLTPLKRVELNLHFDTKEDEHYKEGEKPTKTRTSTPYITLTYKLGRTIDANYKFSFQAQKTADTKIDTSEHTLGVRLQMGTNTTGNIDIKLIDYENEKYSLQNYKATLITAQVDINLR